MRVRTLFGQYLTAHFFLDNLNTSPRRRFIRYIHWRLCCDHRPPEIPSDHNIVGLIKCWSEFVQWKVETTRIGEAHFREIAMTYLLGC